MRLPRRRPRPIPARDWPSSIRRRGATVDLRDELKRLADPRRGEQRRASIDVGADRDRNADRRERRRARTGFATRFAAREERLAAQPRLRGFGGCDAPKLGARRRAAILANMEMWRWEPREMGARRIEVNIPDFSVTVSRATRWSTTRASSSASRQTPTPVFSNVMRYVLDQSAWQVPDSIVKKEILPRLGHLESLGYQVKTIGGRVTVRQPPGDDNALGRLAFMFPNEHSVYLHDTPARELFSRRHTRPEPWLRAGRRSHAPRRTRARVAGEPYQRGDRRTGANSLPAAAAADPHRIFHRLRRRGRRSFRRGLMCMA